MRSKIYVWTILLSLLPIISYAQNQNDSLVQELYVKSGAEKQDKLFSSRLLDLFDQSVQGDDEFQKLPKRVLSIMRESIPEAFAPEKLREVEVREFAEKLSDQDIKEALQWLDSPTGKKCTQLEEAASTPEAQAEMQKFAAGLQDSPPTDERLKSLRELDSALKITESSVEQAINMQVALVLGMLATLPSEQQKRPDDVARELEKTRPTVEAEARSEAFITILYTYRSLSESEIEQYMEFAKSPAGSKYNLVGMAALKKAMNEGAVRWGKTIGNAIKGMKGNSEA